jgi:hypothetical protein
MPTVLRSGPYRLFFYASDGAEPPHVHVERDDSEAKFWLWPLAMKRSSGFRRAEIRRISTIVEQNQDLLMEAWNEFFDS